MSKEKSITVESLKIVLRENKGRSVFANKNFEIREILISSKREYVEPKRT
jgi:hypothetical protein